MLTVFEEKNNTIAFVLITIAAIFWGLFGIVSAVASDITTSPLFFTAVGTFFSLLTSLIVCFLLKIDIRGILNDIVSNKKLLKLMIIRTFAGFNSLALVVGFFFLSNKIIGLLVFESAPMLAVLVSYYVLKKELEHIDSILYSWVLIVFAFIGVIILSLEINTSTENIFELKNNTELLGLIIIFVGLLGSVVVKVLGPKITLMMQDIKKDRTKLHSALGSQLITNFFLFILMSFITIIFYTPGEMYKLLTIDFLFLALFFGVFVEFLPTAIGRLAAALATSHNIFIAWAMTPIIGVFLLWNFGYGELNSTILLSFILILVPNLLLNIQYEKSFSFKVTLAWILLSAMILFYTQGYAISNETYFGSTSSLLVFFALMVGYLTSQLNSKLAYRESLFINLLQKIKSANVDLHNIDLISRKFQQSNSRLTDSIKEDFSRLNIDIENYSEYTHFSFIRYRRLYNIGELFVLLFISLLIIGMTFIYRENNFLYDSYAFIVSTAVIFTLSQVFQTIFFSNYSTQKKYKKRLIEAIVSLLLLAILSISIIILLLSKYNFNVI